MSNTTYYNVDFFNQYFTSKEFNFINDEFLKFKDGLERKPDLDDEIKNIDSLIIKYGERDENEHLIQDESKGIKIKQEYLVECSQKIHDIYELDIQMPDIYFSFDELNSLNLTLRDLELLESFIKV